MDRGNLFRTIALGQVPRILGLADRRDGSATAGCFDRPYWHYLLKDFPNSRLQEGTLLLALLHVSDFPGNRFHGRRALLRWCRDAVRFWASIQHRDGSFDEYYPFERSFCATALSTHAVSEALVVLDDAEARKAGLPAVLRAGEWLARHGNPEVANQEAGALAALYNCHRLAGDGRFAGAVEARKRTLLSLQEPDGCFPEYGGADVGYQSLTLSYLMKYRAASGDPSVLPPAIRGAAFLEGRVRGNGSYDWSTTSRKTQYLYPHGLVLAGSPVAERLLRGLAADEVVSPAWLDDTYCIPMTCDYLLASLAG